MTRECTCPVCRSDLAFIAPCMRRDVSREVSSPTRPRRPACRRVVPGALVPPPPGTILFGGSGQ